MRRRSTLALIGLGAYGVSMAASGVALAVAPSEPVPAVVTVLAEASSPAPEPVEPSLMPLASSSAHPAPAASVPVIRGTGEQLATFVPTRMVLPSGRQAPVQISDVADDGSLVIPDRPDTVGWWDGGAHAGDPTGSLVIAGHVDSRKYGLGALAELKWARPGDVIVLQAGKQRLRYRIQRALQVNQQSLAQDDEFFSQSGPHRLVLITCGGPFDRAKHRYRDNYVVVALPLRA
ncbi:MAG: sortase [Kineosporiaceae bacterium]